MAEYYRCSDCKKVLPLIGSADRSRCPSCGKANGEALSQDKVKQGMEAGTYFNIDPKTSGRETPRSPSRLAAQ